MHLAFLVLFLLLLLLMRFQISTRNHHQGGAIIDTTTPSTASSHNDPSRPFQQHGFVPVWFEDIDNNDTLSSPFSPCKMDRNAFFPPAMTPYTEQFMASLFHPRAKTKTTTTATATISTMIPAPMDDNNNNDKDRNEIHIRNKRRLILIMGSARSGSNLLVDIFKAIDEHTAPIDLDLIPLYEVLHKNGTFFLDFSILHRVFVHSMLPVCSMFLKNDTTTSYNSNVARMRWKSEFERLIAYDKYGYPHQWNKQLRDALLPSSVIASLVDLLRGEASSKTGRTSDKNSSASSSSSSSYVFPQQWSNAFMESNDNMYRSLDNFLRHLVFLKSLPAYAKSPNHNYVVIKHLDFSLTKHWIPLWKNDRERDPFQLAEWFDTFHKVWNDDEIKVVVLWRRSFLASYVSNHKKLATGTHHVYNISGTITNTTAIHPYKASVTVKKGSLEWEFQRWFRFNRELQDILRKKKDGDYYDGTTSSSSTRRSLSSSWEVVEYEDDLSDRSKQIELAKRLVDNVLGIPREKVIGLDDGSLIDSMGQVKLSQQPLSKQITNWEEVMNSGWKFQDYLEGDWETVFASSSSPSSLSR